MNIFKAMQDNANNNKKFKSAIVTTYWKGKKVSPTFIIPMPGRFKNYEVPVTDVTMDIEQGPDASRMTATRIIAGGALLGPVGAILGGMAKKQYAFNNLVVYVEDEVIRIPFKTSEYGEAIKFIEDVARIQANCK